MERDEARRLRAEGYTLAAIADMAGVSAVTVGRWCDGVVAPPGKGARDTQRKHRLAAEAERERGRWEALELVSDPLWVAGTTMYWGEGSKSSGGLRLANTDPDALVLFVSWVRRFHDPQAEFVMHLHLHPGDHEPSSQAYWAGAIGIEPNFVKTFWKGPGTGHRQNTHEHGVCTVRVARSGLMLHRTLGWIDGLAIALPLRMAVA